MTTEITAYDKLYINGAWASSTSTDTLEVVDSVTEEVMATIPSGTAAGKESGRSTRPTVGQEISA